MYLHHKRTILLTFGKHLFVFCHSIIFLGSNWWNKGNIRFASLLGFLECFIFQLFFHSPSFHLCFPVWGHILSLWPETAHCLERLYLWGSSLEGLSSSHSYPFITPMLIYMTPFCFLWAREWISLFLVAELYWWKTGEFFLFLWTVRK